MGDLIFRSSQGSGNVGSPMQSKGLSAIDSSFACVHGAQTFLVIQGLGFK